MLDAEFDDARQSLMAEVGRAGCGAEIARRLDRYHQSLQVVARQRRQRVIERRLGNQPIFRGSAGVIALRGPVRALRPDANQGWRR